MHTVEHVGTSSRWKPNPTLPIKLNGSLITLCAILCFVVASAAEAEPGALFFNCKQATIFQLACEEMGGNSTMVGIANNIVKPQHSQSMEIRFSGSWMQLKLGRLTSNTAQGKRTLATT
jgi:hypothetical protein